MRRSVAFALSLAPTVAYACPACLGQQRRWTGPLVVLGVMLLVPFVVAAIVARAIRAVDRE